MNGILPNTDNVHQYLRNSAKAEFVDLENPDSYCEYNADDMQRRSANGAFINTNEGPKPIICGGYHTAGENRCFFLGEALPGTSMGAVRAHFAVAVIGNGQYMWVTGGWSTGGHLTTTKLVSASGITDGPNLPSKNHVHGMVEIDSNTVMVIGGHTGTAGIRNTYMYDVSNPNSIQLKQTPSPLLTQAKWHIGYGIMTDYGTGSQVVLVLGGHPKQKEIERWVVGSAGNFEVKGNLPFDMIDPKGVSDPSGKGVYLFGNDHVGQADVIVKAYCDSDICTGIAITKRMQLKR